MDVYWTFIDWNGDRYDAEFKTAEDAWLRAQELYRDSIEYGDEGDMFVGSIKLICEDDDGNIIEELNRIVSCRIIPEYR